VRFLFSSLDGNLVESLSKRMIEAGIPCELRCRTGKKGGKILSYNELWVRADIQLQWAVDLLAMFCEVGKN
jgi:hypothetical protein